jgi:hypothetical protein
LQTRTPRGRSVLRPHGRRAAHPGAPPPAPPLTTRAISIIAAAWRPSACSGSWSSAAPSFSGASAGGEGWRGAGMRSKMPGGARALSAGPLKGLQGVLGALLAWPLGAALPSASPPPPPPPLTVADRVNLHQCRGVEAHRVAEAQPRQQRLVARAQLGGDLLFLGGGSGRVMSGVERRGMGRGQAAIAVPPWPWDWAACSPIHGPWPLPLRQRGRPPACAAPPPTAASRRAAARRGPRPAGPPARTGTCGARQEGGMRSEGGSGECAHGRLGPGLASWSQSGKPPQSKLPPLAPPPPGCHPLLQQELLDGALLGQPRAAERVEQLPQLHRRLGRGACGVWRVWRVAGGAACGQEGVAAGLGRCCRGSSCGARRLSLDAASCPALPLGTLPATLPAHPQHPPVASTFFSSFCCALTRARRT